jgi:hypothetical protein
LVRRRERAVRYPKCWARLCPTAISGNQWQSVAISGNQWQSVAISGAPVPNGMHARGHSRRA